MVDYLSRRCLGILALNLNKFLLQDEPLSWMIRQAFVGKNDFPHQQQRISPHAPLSTS